MCIQNNVEYVVWWIKMYRYHKISVYNYWEYVVELIQMLIRGEDDILEGISGLLLSWNKREKRV